MLSDLQYFKHDSPDRYRIVNRDASQLQVQRFRREGNGPKDLYCHRLPLARQTRPPWGTKDHIPTERTPPFGANMVSSQLVNFSSPILSRKCNR